jgi:hypothetical protein
VAIGVIVSFNCAEAGAANEQNAITMAARHTLRRAEMNVECINMAVEFLLRARLARSIGNEQSQSSAAERAAGVRCTREVSIRRGGSRQVLVLAPRTRSPRTRPSVGDRVDALRDGRVRERQLAERELTARIRRQLRG